MSWGDYGVIFKWIDAFMKKGEIRRAKKLTALQKELEHVDEQIKVFKITKNTDYSYLERLMLRQRKLQKQIQSFAH